ncbi:MAG: NAD(P)-dependent oxidoreductase [Chloroflexi bacterium]|nr:NAD(P)-dependent oxidoreductase [Chloroflexota bacterium]
MNVGYIGLGNMGRPMAERLLKAGHRIVGHNRSRGKVSDFVRAGGAGAASPREVADACEVVHTCLTMPPASDDVYLGSDGLIPHARPGHIFVEHSTIGLVQARRLADAAREKGASFLDAPISGRPSEAADGTLSIMVGGDEAAFLKVKPLLEIMGKNVHYCGPVGSGSAVKLAHNLMTSIHFAGIAEGLLLAAKAGVPPRLAFDVFKDSSSSSRTLVDHGIRMVTRDFDRRFNMNLIWKDLGLIAETADAIGVRILMCRMAREVFNEARLAGYGDQDTAMVVRPLEDLVGMKLG